ncbi:hypothetical protein L596_001140 [Steinernema carpocapsae]|uniref:Uncharacterized protein n=1 Tax=Steinernema carpocapsae TaxID=34508 RepID=A0A4U8UKQ4_STECR|nr:hypothetical protein L596_001140 [Steinernema carpocapsae]
MYSNVDYHRTVILEPALTNAPQDAFLKPLSTIINFPTNLLNRHKQSRNAGCYFDIYRPLTIFISFHKL